MRHENSINFLFLTYLLIISCTQCASSRSFNTNHTAKQPVIINNCKDYNKSIKNHLNKRLVPLKNFISPLITDWKYAGINNFTHTVLYEDPIAYVRLPVALALKNVQEELIVKNLGLMFYDAYRPYSVTKLMWKIIPDVRYAANPERGSAHNRGTAVDVSLVNLTTGREVEMPTPFDDFTEKAHHNYMNVSAEVIANRNLLKHTMEKYGFLALSTEWWHYTFITSNLTADILDLSFGEISNCNIEADD